jgi:hypothetical protein
VPHQQFGERVLISTARRIYKLFVSQSHKSLHKLVILNITEGGVKDLLYLPFNIGAKRRSTNAE